MVLALGLEEIATWVRHHHERWDGTGYPDGLAGERIPLPSRILGAADALDAMTTARAYREPRSLEEAIGELVEQADRQFDPQVADCLVELLENGNLRLSEERRLVTSYTISDGRPGSSTRRTTGEFGRHCSRATSAGRARLPRSPSPPRPSERAPTDRA